MTTLLGTLMSRVATRPERRSWWPLDTVTMGGNTYPLGLPGSTSLNFRQEDIGAGYASYAHMAMMANPIVFACMEYRRKTFAQAHFQWKRLRNGGTGPAGQYFGTPELGLLEVPWTNATTPDLLSAVIQHADLGGNAIIVRTSDPDTGAPMLTPLRPDWVSIIAASTRTPEQGSSAIDAKLMGYAYWPGGKGYGEPVILLPEEVAHFAPTPDPMARWRGMSWITPAIREIMGDQAASMHKLKYFENGGGPGVVVKMDPAVVNTLEKFDAWVETLEQGHASVANAYRTWYVSGAVDVTTVGDNLRQQDFKVTQGAGESRIASDAGVPPILVGFSEGLASATYSNYGMARRSYIDATLWDLWNNLAGSLQSILTVPGGARLAVDPRGIPLLQEDEKDRAEIQQMDMSAIAAGITAGFEPDAVVDAIVSGDLQRLVGSHSGLYSVQLQAPGTQQPAEEPTAEPTEEPPQRALIAQARQHLLDSGAKPTLAAIAESLDVSESTARRWRDA